MPEQKRLENNIKCLEKMELYFGPSLELIIGGMEKLEPPNVENEKLSLEQITLNSIPLIMNELCYETILEINEKTGRNIVHPIYLYFDVEMFLRFINENELAGIENIHRLVIIVGKEAFDICFGADDVIEPDVILGDTDGTFQEWLGRISQRKKVRLAEMQGEMEEYYRNNEEEIRERIKNGNYTVCILKYTFEPLKFRKFYRELQNTFADGKRNVVVCDERGLVFRTPIISNIYKYKPDIVFQINKSRDERAFLGEKVALRDMDNLVYINWVQDIHPAVLSKEYAKSIGKYDFVFSLFDRNMMKRYQFPEDHIIYKGIMSVDGESYAEYKLTDAEKEKYECDICFVGSILDNAQVIQFIYQLIRPYMGEQAAYRVIEEAIAVLGQIYDAATGDYIVDNEQLDERIDNLQSEIGFDENVKLYVYRAFSVARYNTMRTLILKQLAAEKKYKIVLYGECGLDVEGIEYGGFLADPKELSKAIQGAKLTLQINPDATMNQRVIESLLSKVMVLVFQMNEKCDVSNIKQYLEEGDGIVFFSSKRELIDWCDKLLEDENLRNLLARKGFLRAKEHLTTKILFENMMMDLQEKIG